MSDIPKEAVAAMKLNRADAVKLVAASMIELAANDVAACEAALIEARTEFFENAVAIVRSTHFQLLGEVCGDLGRTVESLHASCTYRVYAAGSDSGDTVEVVFSDCQQSFDSKFRIVLSAKLGTLSHARDRWLAAIMNLERAADRDLRVGAMSKEARDLLIKAALNDSDEGKAVVASIKALSASLKGKV